MTAHIVTTYAPAITSDPPEWTLAALCQQVDPELFFPEKGGSTREAKRICAACPVRANCLQFALDHAEQFGVYGGLSAGERRRLRPPQPRPYGRTIRHGTEGGYYTHRSRGEQPCVECQEAAREGWQRRKQRRREAVPA